MYISMFSKRKETHKKQKTTTPRAGVIPRSDVLSLNFITRTYFEDIKVSLKTYTFMHEQNFHNL